MSGLRLRKQCVSIPEKTVLVACYQTPIVANQQHRRKLVGHAFATVWDYNGGNFFFLIDHRLPLLTHHILVRNSWLGHPARRKPVPVKAVHCYLSSSILEGILDT